MNVTRYSPKSRLNQITNHEAKEDGFTDANDMRRWLSKSHDHKRLIREGLNKLTLRRVLPPVWDKYCLAPKGEEGVCQ